MEKEWVFVCVSHPKELWLLALNTSKPPLKPRLAHTEATPVPYTYLVLISAADDVFFGDGQ